jgi:hypothetical protein
MRVIEEARTFKTFKQFKWFKASEKLEFLGHV